ncbi:hypothetical protein T4A_12054 [Trichinella pseudospiralis]|uniref:Uncharacterized protein n=1 Tax=Trichinella pseudospiralis TaxID=6337 RepID=A0A0V1E2P3_TRIPS|nr:hypothetical protein T4A_12054 [Trichinella pseudospiralis]
MTENSKIILANPSLIPANQNEYTKFDKILGWRVLNDSQEQLVVRNGADKFVAVRFLKISRKLRNEERFDCVHCIWNIVANRLIPISSIFVEKGPACFAKNGEKRTFHGMGSGLSSYSSLSFSLIQKYILFNSIALFENDELPLCIRSRKCISRGSKLSTSKYSIPYFAILKMLAVL